MENGGGEEEREGRAETVKGLRREEGEEEREGRMSE